MSISINTKNSISYNGYANTTKPRNNKLNSVAFVNSKDAVKVDISRAGKELAGNNANSITAINNLYEMNDPVIDYFNRVGTIERVDPDGTIQWDLSSADTDNMESVIFSNISQEDYAFWSSLTDDPTFLGLKYTENEIKSRLLEAGIKPGFFSVTVGDKSATHFFTQGKGAATVYSKEQYDNHYKYVTSDSYLSRYNEGQKLLIGEKEYSLGTDRKLNIPYGEDVYDIKTIRD